MDAGIQRAALTDSDTDNTYFFFFFFGQILDVVKKKNNIITCHFFAVKILRK